jgi:uncharacterized membrane protein
VFIDNRIWPDEAEIMPQATNMLRLLLVSALPIAAFCFNLQPATQLRTFRSGVTTIPVRSLRVELSSSTGAAFGANGDSQTDDVVLRHFEKKEAQMRKLQEGAQSKLSEAEAAIKLLQSKKQEYLKGVELDKAPPGGNFSETAVRSAVKAFLWRIVAGSVTFITSLRFSGSVATALSIVGSDFFSKSFTMFIGERLMNKSKAGRTSGADGIGRSLTKALIWRLFAICNTLTVAFFVAKDLSMASKIAGSDAIFKTALMFFYERIWARIDWGKEFEIEFSI